MNILIVSAAKFESQPTLASLKEAGIIAEYFECGIGPLNAAKSVYSLKQRAKGKDVIFIGTCGIFSNFSSIEVVTATSVSWLPAGVRHSLSQGIEGIYPEIDLSRSTEKLTTQRKIKMVCSSAISNNNKLPSDYSKKDCGENLELYSVAEEILNASNSFTNFFGVTNEICEDARSQWKNNFDKAAELTSKSVLNYLTSFC